MHPVEIRPEQPADRAAIAHVTELAFRDMPYSAGDEQDVIDRLRAADALVLSLVALVDEEVVGHIAFSPAHSAGGGSWVALGPVSVVPGRQRQGIGSRLIERGLSLVRKQGARGCILVGDPGYYRRFGFELSPGNVPDGEPEEFFMLKRFDGPPPAGRFRFHEAFYG